MNFTSEVKKPHPIGNTLHAMGRKIHRIVWIPKYFGITGTIHAVKEMLHICLDPTIVSNNTGKQFTYSLHNPKNWKTIKAITRDNGGDTVVLTGTFARREYTYVEDLFATGKLDKNLRVLDLWATIGDFGLYLQYAGFEPYLICVEWDQESAKICQDNMKTNDLQGTVIPNPITSNGRNVCFDATSIQTQRSIIESSVWNEIPSTTLATVLADTQKIDLCKIDIEWAEFELLTEENKPHFSKMRHIILEYHTTSDDFEKNIWMIQSYFSEMFTIKREKTLQKRNQNGEKIIIWMVYLEK